MVIRPWPGAPGVFSAVSHGEHVLLANVAVAGLRWCQLADVLICPAGHGREQAHRCARKALRDHPGCVAVAVAWDGRLVLLGRRVVGDGRRPRVSQLVQAVPYLVGSR